MIGALLIIAVIVCGCAAVAIAVPTFFLAIENPVQRSTLRRVILSIIGTAATIALIWTCIFLVSLSISLDDQKNSSQMRQAFTKIEKVQQTYYSRHNYYAPTMTDVRLLRPGISKDSLIQQMNFETSADHKSLYISSGDTDDDGLFFSLTASKGMVIDRACQAPPEAECHNGSWSSSKR